MHITPNDVIITLFILKMRERTVIMGYGKNLKDILDSKNMTVKELARKAKIAPTTLYSIIQRDTAIRYDTAFKIANILDVPVNSLCKDNPYEDGEILPILPEMVGDSSKSAFISTRTSKILKKFDFTELPMVDQLIADLYVLDDGARKELFDYVNLVKKYHTSPEREKELKSIK